MARLVVRGFGLEPSCITAACRLRNKIEALIRELTPRLLKTGTGVEVLVSDFRYTRDGKKGPFVEVVNTDFPEKGYEASSDGMDPADANWPTTGDWPLIKILVDHIVDLIDVEVRLGGGGMYFEKRETPKYPAELHDLDPLHPERDAQGKGPDNKS